MNNTLSSGQIEVWVAMLQSHLPPFDLPVSSAAGPLQPVHVVYGGAQLFRYDIVEKLGQLALRSLEEFAPDANTFAAALGVNENFDEVYHRVVETLQTAPIADYRIDFEDGYGLRPDAEEDEYAVAAAKATAEGIERESLPGFFGVRIKSLAPETATRALRTLDLYLTQLVELAGGRLPDGFVITLPKVEHEAQVATLVDVCNVLEMALDLYAGALKVEVMVESPRALIGSDGGAVLPRVLKAAGGRLRGAHFGAFDFTAACNISANLQDLRHPVCDFARAMMQTSLAGTSVWLSDSVTTQMPVAVHRGTGLSAEQKDENRRSVHAAWKMHYDNIRHSLANGFYQSWDLHPAQLPVRYAAVQMFFRENLVASATRLRNFIERATQASRLGSQFDDAATAQGLLNFFAQALASKVVTDREAEGMIGLTGDELRGRSFAKIMAAKNIQARSD